MGRKPLLLFSILATSCGQGLADGDYDVICECTEHTPQTGLYSMVGMVRAERWTVAGNAVTMVSDRWETTILLDGLLWEKTTPDADEACHRYDRIELTPIDRGVVIDRWWSRGKDHACDRYSEGVEECSGYAALDTIAPIP